MRSFTIFLLLILSFNCISQSYESIFNNIDSLRILYDFGFSQGETQAVKICGDTTIDKFTYKKLKFDDFCCDYFFYEVICSPDFLISHNSYCLGFFTTKLLLRQDSTNSKLYLYSLESKREFLIMDLNLGENDIFKIIRPEEDTIYYRVDTVFSLNDRKIIEFSNELHYERHDNIKLQFIEGIGPNWGLFYGYNEANNLLLCAYKDNIQTFQITDNSDCTYSWTGDCFCCDCPWCPECLDVKQNYQDNELIISQNNSELTINVKNNDSFTFYVYDINGKILFEKSNIQNEINICLNRNRFYFIRIVLKDRTVTEKVLIN